MLSFLERVGFHQPSLDLLTNFFARRRLSRDQDVCVAQSPALASELNRRVTNAGASSLNWARVRKDVLNIEPRIVCLSILHRAQTGISSLGNDGRCDEEVGQRLGLRQWSDQDGEAGAEQADIRTPDF